MSTGSNQGVSAGEAGVDRNTATRSEARSQGGAPSTAEEGPAFDLGAQTAAFVDTFERWARRKSIEAGASIPRLRLLYSVHCHGPRKMADLADELSVTPRNVTALVDGLEAEGLVRRTPHATDRRVTMVELTCNSDRVASQFAAYRASVEGLFAGLDEADLAAFRRLIATLDARMHADSATPATPEKETRND
jgi:DNA-binding MarR family transcriptional regulator